MAQSPSTDKLDRQIIVIASVVVVGAIMSILDTTIVNVGLDTLHQKLNSPIATIQWVVTGYMLALAAVIPISGWAAERFGTKRVYLISLVLFAVRHLRPADAVTFGVVLQTARLLGGEAGNAFMQTYVRVREQVDSNLLGLHVMSGDVDTADRLAAYANAIAARSDGVAGASARAASLLVQAIRNQANVLSYRDGFIVVAFAVIVMLLLTALLRPAPTPA